MAISTEIRNGKKIQKLQHSLGFLVNGLARLMKNALEAKLQSAGMGATVWTVLMALGEEDGQSQTDLSRRTYLDGATITRALDILEAKGFIERKRNNTDRRVQIVTLTDVGNKSYLETALMGMRVNNEVTTELDSKDRHHLEENIRGMIDRLHQVNNGEVNNDK